MTRATPTLGELGADAGVVAAMARDAERLGLRVGALRGRGAVAAVFDADPPDHGPCVLKIPWPPQYPVGGIPLTIVGDAGPNRPFQVSETGPADLTRPVSFDEAALVLRESADFQARAGVGRPLARLLAPLELARCPAALYERVEGPGLHFAMVQAPARARAALAPLLGAVLELHESYGAHGDLKPQHVVLTEEGPVLLDPLPVPGWIGSIGYALPLPMPRDDGEQRELQLCRDLVAMVAIIAECWSGSSVWNEALMLALLNRGERPWHTLTPERVQEQSAERLALVPGQLGTLLRGAAALCVEVAFGHARVEAGSVTATLEQLAGLCEELPESPSTIPPTLPPPAPE